MFTNIYTSTVHEEDEQYLYSLSGKFSLGKFEMRETTLGVAHLAVSEVITVAMTSGMTIAGMRAIERNALTEVMTVASGVAKVTRVTRGRSVQHTLSKLRRRPPSIKKKTVFYKTHTLPKLRKQPPTQITLAHLYGLSVQ